ncbi:MAG: family 43 glycosylhydrolase [Lachnospiraceae bacterium]|nr:family 43 glycosylhydrolase [Lachnospiraceae bacterium]
MRRKSLWKAGTAMLLAAAMLVTSVPVSATAAEVDDTSAATAALAEYDFADFAVSEADANVLTDGTRQLTLESAGSGVKPTLVEDTERGQVLSLTQQNYANRGYALLPENPFAGKSIDNGLTVNFWTKTVGNPAGANCLLDFEVAPATSGRAGTYAMNQSMIYWNTTDQNGNYADMNIGNMNLAAANGWVMYTMVLEKDGISFYRNGYGISHSITGSNMDYTRMLNDIAGTADFATPEQTKVRLGASMATYWNCAGALMDDVAFYGKALAADEVADIFHDSYLGEEIALETVTVSGANKVDEGKTIQLSVAYTPANTTVRRDVTWKVVDESIASVDENGVVTGLKGGTTTVTATIAGVASEAFEITVKPTVNSLEAGYYLTVYSTTTPFYAAASNVDQETQSVYMAVSKDGQTFDVLNNGGGVIFSKNTSGTLKVTKPMIYKNEEGFAVVAQDSNISKGYHIFTSEDGVNYYDDTLEATSSYEDVPVLNASKFSLLLDGENLLEKDANITLGNAVVLTEEEYTYIVNKLGTVVNTGLEAIPAITLKAGESFTEEDLAKKAPTATATYSDGSVQKFNIDWTDALKGKDLTKPGTYKVTGTVKQTKYLNNLKELNGSTLPEDDPENVGDEADNYDEETQTNYYDATKYVEGMADPCIFWDEKTEHYYMTGSYFPEEGDEIDENDNTQQYDRVILRKSKTLEGLQNRDTQVTLWKVGNQGYDNNGEQVASGYRYIWAPEIHRVGNYWVIYFTESHKSGDLFNIYSHALVLDGDKDPYETALTASDEESQWKDYKVVLSEDIDASVGVNKSINTAFCLDMTYFKDAVNGKSYVIWAGKPTAAYKGGNTDLFIATVDEAKPWVLTSDTTRITKADYGWERIRYCVNEGATVLQKDGNIFMCYSVSGTGSEYAIGMCSAKAGTDLLDVANWTKSPYPLLTSRDVDGEEGPGHNSFTVDQDGNPIFVYHARPTSHNYQHCGWDGTKSSYNSEPLNDPCRHARLKRVHWAADGTPILKMTYDEELLDENQTIEATIVVKGLDKDSVVSSAIANYDFENYVPTTENSDVLSNGTQATILLEAAGTGTKPTLVKDEVRGQVLSLTQQGTVDEGTTNYGCAKLSGNPFVNRSVEEGLSINFWTKTTGTAGGGRCLMDFEVASATTGRAGTFAVNQTMLYWNTTDQNGNYMDFDTNGLGLANKDWTMVTITLTEEGITFYSNGKKIAHSVTGSNAENYAQMISDLTGTLAENPGETAVRLGASMATYWTGAGALMDDISFYGKALSSTEVAKIYEETALPQVAVTKVTVNGENTVDVGKTIQLSTTLTPADTTARVTTWESSDEKVLTVDADGKVTGIASGTANVTATVGGVKSATFKIIVTELVDSLEEGYYLTVYSTTTPFYASAGNLAQETQSVYMAVSKDGKTFDVLNNGGGVIFSKNTSGTLRVTDPKIFKDGNTFVVTAQDATASKGVHIFTSEDGVHYYNDTLEASTEYSAVALRKSNFKLMLDGENILDKDSKITLGNAIPITEEEYTYIVNKLGTVVNTGLESLNAWDVKTTDKITEAELAKQFPSVNATYSDGSTQKFNIDWSGALKNVDLTKEGTYTVTGKVNQTKYLNNLKALNGSELPEDDPENVGPEADNYDEDTKTNYYDATKYVEGMADPCIFWDKQTGYYYMTGSYFPEEGDAIDEDDNTQQYDRVVLRRSKTLEGLQNRDAQVTIWKVGNQGYIDNGKEVASGYRYIWAPEIHRVGDYWVVYFTESHKNGDLFNIYSHALILDGNQDPYETALTYGDEESQWTDYKMVLADGVSTGGLNASINTSFCLDMTYFKDEVNGQSYVIWAGKPTAAYQGGNTDLFIAHVDEEEPWVITSDTTRITKADYGWERVRYCVNEGATVLQKDGKIFMCYSASGTGSEYAIGMCSAEGGEDLLDPDNWTKSPYPLLTSRDVDGEEGPGHNSFTVDQDGNVIFVYHARPTSHNDKHCGWNGSSSSYNSEPLNDPCRHARLKRVHWAADGTPILKMTYEEELLEENYAVTATIHVAKGAVVTPVPNPTPVEKEDTTITLNTQKVVMGLKEKNVKLTATVVGGAANQAVTWTSNNESVVTVKDGKLTTSKKKTGTATITATTADGKTATCTVTVKKAPTKIILKKAKVTLKKNKTHQIKVKKYKPSNAASYKLTYSSSKKKVATVSKTGLIKAKKKGTATITVKTYNGKKAKIKVTVK